MQKGLIKKGATLVLALSLLSGCASYTTQSFNPTPEHPYAVSQEKGDLKVLAVPVVSKEDAKRVFDRDDLARKGFVPIYITITNLSPNSYTLSKIYLKSSDGKVFSQLDANKAADSVKKGVVGRAVGWLILAGPIGAGVSAAHSASVNEKIFQDLVNKQFKASTINARDIVSGYLYFEVPENTESLDGYRLVLEFKGPQEIAIDIPLKGKITAK